MGREEKAEGVKHDGRGHVLPFRVGILQQTPVLRQLPQDAAPILPVDKGKVGMWWEKQHLGTPHPRLSAALFSLWDAQRLRSLRRGPWL